MTTKELKLDVNVEYNLVSIDTKNADKDPKYIECLIQSLQDCGVTVINHTYCTKNHSSSNVYITQTECKKPILCNENGDILPGQTNVEIKSSSSELTTATVQFNVLGGIYDKNN